MYVVDLHNHTPLVRGDYRGAESTTLDEIAESAVRAGIDVFGVTDHFSTANLLGMGEALDRAADAAGREVLVVGGAELRISWLEEEAHIVILFSRATAAERCAEVFSDAELDSALQDVSRLSHVVVDLDPAWLIELVHALDGLVIAAHVDRVWGSYRLAGTQTFERIATSGVDAIEVIEPSSARLLGELYPNCAMIRTSDSHALDEVGSRSCQLAMDELSFAGLNAGLRKGSCF